MEMKGYDFDATMLQRYRSAMERERRRVEEARHKKNLAAFVDFASNLVTLIGRSKGGRYSITTNLSPQYRNLYDKAKGHYGELMLDYNGIIADGKLRAQGEHGRAGLRRINGVANIVNGNRNISGKTRPGVDRYLRMSIKDDYSSNKIK